MSTPRPPAAACAALHVRAVGTCFLISSIVVTGWFIWAIAKLRDAMASYRIALITAERDLTIVIDPVMFLDRDTAIWVFIGTGIFEPIIGSMLMYGATAPDAKHAQQLAKAAQRARAEVRAREDQKAYLREQELATQGRIRWAIVECDQWITARVAFGRECCAIYERHFRQALGWRGDVTFLNDNSQGPPSLPPSYLGPDE